MPNAGKSVRGRVRSLQQRWQMLWRPLSLLLRPFGELTLEILLVRDLANPIPEVQAGVELAIRTAREDEIERLGELYRAEPYLYLDGQQRSDADSQRQGDRTIHPRRETPYRNRLARGEKCFLAFAGTELAHMNWLCFSFGEDPVPGHRILLEPLECYTTDAITFDAFRGKNIHAFVLGQMLQAARGAGCHTAYTVTNIEHRNSFGAFEQLGWQILGTLLCFAPRDRRRPKLVRLSGNIEPLLRENRN